MWYEGAFVSSNAGQGLAVVWDALVVLNPCWSVYDAAAGTNAKVYRCHDAAENCDFYVLVDDNYSGYWLIQLWEGWDAVGHAGTGDHIEVSSSTFVFTGRRPTTGFLLSVKDHRVIFIETEKWTAQYIGQPRRYDPTKNTPLILSYSSGTAYVCALIYIDTAAPSACRFLFDEAGNQALARGDGGARNASDLLTFGIDGRFHFPGEKVVAGLTTNLAIGTLDGVVDFGAMSGQSRSPVTGQRFMVDGEMWIAVVGVYSTEYAAAVRIS